MKIGGMSLEEVFAGLPGPALCFRCRKLLSLSHQSQFELLFRTRYKMSASGEELFKGIN